MKLREFSNPFILYGIDHKHLSAYNLVSQDPSNYRDAPTEGIRRVLEIITAKSIPRREVLNTDKIGKSTRILPLCTIANPNPFYRFYTAFNHRRHQCFIGKEG